MEYVDGIRDLKKIKEIKKLLKAQSKRDYLLFVFGINTGLKISDILGLKIADVHEENGNIKEFLELNLESQGKKCIYLNAKVKQAVLLYLQSIPTSQTDYLFKSSKSDQPITRQQAYRIINKAAKEVGIEGKIGTHSMRKTFGYHAYVKGISISLLQALFNHSSPSETLKYLGIQKETIKTKIDVNL